MAYSSDELERMRVFATQRQNEFIDLVLENGGSVTRAEQKLGCSQGLIARSIRALKYKLVLKGDMRELGIINNVPDPFEVDRVSIYNGRTETSPAHWLKINLKEEERNKFYLDAIQEAASNPYPIQISEPSNDNYETDIVPFINMGDAHIGMIAHAFESGFDFNLEIAERELLTAFDLAIDKIAPCEKIVFQDMGDATHYENFGAKTEHGGHQMDYDKRFPKMIEIYTKITRYIIEKCLTKARYVDYIANQGNHSRVNDAWIALTMRLLFEETGRVNVIDNASVVIPYRIGKTFVLCHHGDKMKPERLRAVMASDYKEDWGETDYHYIDGGHIHKNMVKNDFDGAIWESFNQLAPNDKYSHDGGWRARKCLTIVYRSRTEGEVERKTISAQMVWRKITEKLGIEAPVIKRAHVG